MGVGEVLKAGGWKQGAIVDRCFLAELEGRVANPPDKPVCCGVIISQSCDLFYKSLDEEPFAEILLGFESTVCADGARRGNQTFGKNPRALCLALHRGEAGGAIWVEFRPFWIVRVPRNDLLHLCPADSHSLTEASLRILVRWLSQRYDRAAFPDEFNNRLNKARKKLKAIHKRISPNVSALYARLFPEGEIDPAEKYSADFLATVPKAHEADVAAVESEMHRLRELLHENGIEAEIRVRSERQVPLSAIRSMKRLPLDSLSLAGADNDPEPVD